MVVSHGGHLFVHGGKAMLCQQEMFFQLKFSRHPVCDRYDKRNESECGVDSEIEDEEDLFLIELVDDAIVFICNVSKEGMNSESE